MKKMRVPIWGILLCCLCFNVRAQEKEYRKEMEGISLRIKGVWESDVCFSSAPTIFLEGRMDKNIAYHITRKEEKESGTLQEGEDRIRTELFQEGIQEVQIFLEEQEVWRGKIHKDTKAPKLMLEKEIDLEVEYEEIPEIRISLIEEEGGSGAHQVVCYQDGEQLVEGKDSIVINAKAKQGKSKSEFQVKGWDKAGNEVGTEFSVLWKVNQGVVASVVSRKEGKAAKSGEEKKDDQPVTVEEEKEKEGERKGENASKDLEKPKIQGLEEIRKKYIKEFVLRDSPEELILDDGMVRYEMWLNGRLYGGKERFRKEGVHRLEIRAKDVSGNESYASAEFTIDRTGPNIQIQGIEDGGVYGKPVSFQIYTTGKKDWIKKVAVNKKHQKIKDGKYEGALIEEGDYRIEVEAMDSAGNLTKKEIFVKRVEQISWIEHQIKRIGKAFMSFIKKVLKGRMPSYLN